MKCKFKKKGEAYIDTVVTVFINLIILYLVLNLFSYMITYQKLNHAADNIIRCAAINGTTDASVIEKDINEYITNEGFDRSKVDISFDSTEYMSGSSNDIQFGDSIILNLKTNQSFKFIGKSGTSLFDISVNKTSLSEKYHQSNGVSGVSGGILKRNGVIPEGCTYTHGYQVCDCENTNNLNSSEPCGICGYHFSGVATILTAGDNFPEVPSQGDIYVEGDYEYCYNLEYYAFWQKTTPSPDGWGVRVLYKTKSTYGEIISEIAGQPVTNISYTFMDCTSLETAPTIPNTVEKMESTFSDCQSLTGTIEINANPNYSCEGCFTFTVNPITITGSCSDETKAKLAATANNNNVTY